MQAYLRLQIFKIVIVYLLLDIVVLSQGGWKCIKIAGLRDTYECQIPLIM